MPNAPLSQSGIEKSGFIRGGIPLGGPRIEMPPPKGRTGLSTPHLKGGDVKKFECGKILRRRSERIYILPKKPLSARKIAIFEKKPVWVGVKNQNTTPKGGWVSLIWVAEGGRGKVL